MSSSEPRKYTRLLMAHGAEIMHRIWENQKPLLYLRYAKCAGTFLSKYFDTYYKNQVITILHREPYRKERYLLEFKNKFDKYFKFVFVRNPWEWQVSLYFHRLQSWQNPNTELFKNTFTSFEDWVLKGKDLDSDPSRFGGIFHWEQDLYKQICYYKNLFIPDYVAKTETMEDDIRRIFQINNIELVRSVEAFRNESKSSNHISDKRKFDQNVLNRSMHEHYSKYYSDELIEIVYTENKEIIEKYNYEFEDKRNE